MLPAPPPPPTTEPSLLFVISMERYRGDKPICKYNNGTNSEAKAYKHVEAAPLMELCNGGVDVDVDGGWVRVISCLSDE